MLNICLLERDAPQAAAELADRTRTAALCHDILLCAECGSPPSPNSLTATPTPQAIERSTNEHAARTVLCLVWPLRVSTLTPSPPQATSTGKQPVRVAAFAVAVCATSIHMSLAWSDQRRIPPRPVPILLSVYHPTRVLTSSYWDVLATLPSLVPPGPIGLLGLVSLGAAAAVEARDGGWVIPWIRD